MSKTKTSKRKTSHRVPVYRRPWVIIIFFLAMAAAVVVALIFIKPRTTEQSTTQSNPTTNNSASTSSNSTTPETNSTGSATPAEPEDKVTQYEGEDPNTMSELTGYLTRKGVDDGVLTVVAVVNQYLQTPGYCTITLKNSNGQMVYTASRDAVPDVTTSICDPFEIPVTNFAAGTYQIEIHLAGDNKQGQITEEVEL